MRQLAEALHLDEQYMTLHPTNFRRCTADDEKERYKKQLYNILTRRNTHVQSELLKFQRQYKLYRERVPLKRVVRSRNLVVNRPQPSKEYMKTDATSQLLVRVPATANISLDCSHLHDEENRHPVALVFSSRNCIQSNKLHFHERRSQLALQDQNKHTSNKNSGNATLAMVGLKMRRPSIGRRFQRMSAEEQELLVVNPEDKENGEVLPGIFRTKEALVRFTKNFNPLRAASPKSRKQNCQRRLMQGLLYLERVHKKAQEYDHVLTGHRVPYH